MPGLRLELVGGFVIAVIGGGDLVAGRLQRLGNRGADAARAAGDDCDSCHCFPPEIFDRAPSARVRRAPFCVDCALPFDRHRDAHAAADAERREALLGVATRHLVQKRRQNARAGGADRVADGDGAAVDVDDRGVPAQVLVDRERLRGEGFVRLDEIEVLDRPAGLLQRLARRGDRARSP